MRTTSLFFLCLACGHASCPEPTSRSTQGSTVEASAVPAPVPSPLAEVALTPRPDLARHFEEAGFDGSFAAWRADGSGGVCVGDCETRRPAASTFKIPHALLALELGVLSGPDHELPWDGVDRGLEVWNHDHTLRTAIRDSTVWYFRRLAPFVGRERMQVGLERFAFGNAEIGEELDAFWLNGSLRISPREQVAFWHRLHEDAFDVRPEARAAVLEVTERARDAHGVLRGKTGWYRMDGAPENVGWFVGCVERQERTCFATVIHANDPMDHDAFRDARIPLSRALLAAIGLPAPE
ncbi:MAG: class D beta-lactamase [Sandaracinus sp.]|nr:class D beta-lactamase [Sandaracinus sp.]